MERRFEANLLNNGISPDGRFAICQTCNSDSSDSGVMCLFDLASGNVVWKRVPETGWAEDYGFDAEYGILTLQYKDLGAFRYRLSSGDLLDSELWIAKKIQHGSGFELLGIAQERLRELGDSASESEHREILDILGNALKRGLKDYPNQQAAVYRAMGEIHERMGNLPLAMRNYEQALKQNPKVGVKRKLKELKQSHER